MDFSWPHRAAGKTARRGAARVGLIGIATVTVAGAAALAAPAMSAMAAPVDATTTVINMNTLNTETAGPVTVPFTVTNNVAGDPAPTGTVTISDPPDIPDQPANPAFTGCTGTLTPGANGTSTGTCVVNTPTLAWGFVLMRATYNPDSAAFATSNTGDTEYKIINLMPTATTITPATATPGAAVTLVAAVLPAAQAAASAHTAGGNLLAAFSETGGDTVNFTANGAPIAACQNVKLQWNATTLENYVNCAYTPNGTVAIAAVFSGDEYAATSTGTETLTVKAPVSATKTTMPGVSGQVGSKITLAAKVAGGSTPTGTVKFIQGTKTLCSATLSNGAAHCTYAFTVVGSHTVEAVYAGDATHAASHSTVTVKVTKQSTSVKVTASKASAGKVVTLTATVKSLSAATGTVTFSVNGHTVCTAKVVNGKATCKYTWHKAGTYKVTATYNGNSTHLASKGTVSVKVA
jgi:trimeric autotransporter adhesin